MKCNKCDFNAGDERALNIHKTAAHGDVPVGRPTERNADVDRKIEEAAAFGASMEEIAYYAGVHRATLYRWTKDDLALRDRIQELMERPVLKARQTIVQSLNDADHAKWYLERKKKVEFSQRTEHTGAEGAAIATEVTGIDIDKIAAEVEAKLKEQKTEQ